MIELKKDKLNSIIYKRVFFHDTDAMGVVYHSKYLNWLEESRLDLLETHYKPLHEMNILFMPVSISIDYKIPAKFGDKVLLYSEVVSFTRCTISIHNKIIRDNDVICNSDVKLACVSKVGRLSRIPLDLLNILNFNKEHSN